MPDHQHRVCCLWYCLCAAGCRVRDFRALGDQYNLGFHLEAKGKATQNMKQALAGKGLSNIVGITGREDTCPVCGICCQCLLPCWFVLAKVLASVASCGAGRLELGFCRGISGQLLWACLLRLRVLGLVFILMSVPCPSAAASAAASAV